MRQSTFCWLCRYPDKEGKEGHDCRLPSGQTGTSSALLHTDLPQASCKHKMVQVWLTSKPFPKFKITVVLVQALIWLYIKIFVKEKLVTNKAVNSQFSEDTLSELQLFSLQKQRLQKDLTTSWREPTRKAGEGLLHGCAVIGQRVMALTWKMVGLDWSLWSTQATPSPSEQHSHFLLSGKTHNPCTTITIFDF